MFCFSTRLHGQTRSPAVLRDVLVINQQAQGAVPGETDDSAVIKALPCRRLPGVDGQQLRVRDGMAGRLVGLLESLEEFPPLEGHDPRPGSSISFVPSTLEGPCPVRARGVMQATSGWGQKTQHRQDETRGRRAQSEWSAPPRAGASGTRSSQSSRASGSRTLLGRRSSGAAVVWFETGILCSLEGGAKSRLAHPCDEVRILNRIIAPAAPIRGMTGSPTSATRSCWSDRRASFLGQGR